MPATRPPVYLSPAEAAAYVGVTTPTILRWIAESRLVARRFGPRVQRIHIDDLNALGQEIPNGRTAA